MTALAAWWDDYWFRPTAPTNLGLCRLLFFAVCIWSWFVADDIHYIAGFSDYPDALYLPHGVMKLLPRISADTMTVLIRVLEVSLILAAVGLLTRVSTLIAAALSLFVLSQMSMYGKIVYFTLPGVVLPWLFALSRSGDALSIDALIRRRLPRWPLRRRASSGPSAEYQWPVQVGCVYAVMLFFTAGAAKLYHGGVDWAFSGTLLSVLQTDTATQHCRVGSPQFPSVTEFMINRPYLLHSVALGWLLFELASPLALIRGRARPVVAALLVLTVVPSALIGRIPLLLIASLVFLIPWANAIDRIARRGRVT